MILLLLLGRWMKWKRLEPLIWCGSSLLVSVAG
jgi:hypothetical protein